MMFSVGLLDSALKVLEALLLAAVALVEFDFLSPLCGS